MGRPRPRLRLGDGRGGAWTRIVLKWCQSAPYVKISEIRIESDGLHITAHFPNREEVVKLREFLERKRMDVEIHGLYRPRQSSATTAMSEKQRAALFTAYEHGYFDVPKGATPSELADELDISPSSLSGRLKRAQQHLVEAYIRQDRMIEGFE